MRGVRENNDRTSSSPPGCGAGRVYDSTSSRLFAYLAQRGGCQIRARAVSGVGKSDTPLASAHYVSNSVISSNDLLESRPAALGRQFPLSPLIAVDFVTEELIDF